jgi:hypothetical protein
MVKVRTPQDLLKVLKENKDSLRKRYHVRNIGIFGSCMRSEATAESDLDILIDFEDGAELGILGFMEVERYLTDLFGMKVDLVERSALKPRIGSVVLKEVVFV